MDRLLTHRSELNLTAEQVQRLQEIDRRTDEKDRALVQKLEALRGRPMGQPLQARTLSAAEQAKLQQSRAAMQPLMTELRGLHAAAIAEARAVLSPEQQAKANAYLYPNRAAGQGGRWQGMGLGQGMGRGRGAGMHGGRGMGPGAGPGCGMARANCPRGGFGAGR